MDIELGNSMIDYCPLHPSGKLVGICASCLKERLYCLKRQGKGKNKLWKPALQNIDYTSDSDQLSLHNFVPHTLTSRGKRENIVARKKFLWLTRTKSPPKDRRTFFSLRSFIHKLRRNKEEDTCISHEDSFISIKLDANEKSSLPCKMVGVGSVTATATATARSSTTSLHSIQWEWDCDWDCEGLVPNSSSSCLESYYLAEARRCSEYLQQDAGGSGGGGGVSSSLNSKLENPDPHPHPVRWRTRMQALFHIKSKSKSKSVCSNNVLKDYYHNQNHTSKMWSLSSLYHNYNKKKNGPGRHCITKCSSSSKRAGTATKKSWMTNLTSPKWSLH